MPHATNGDVRLHWETQGTGEPVLLIHGLGYSLDLWHRTAPVLAREFQVLSFDNRGVGRSDVPPGPYTIDEMARDAVAVLDAAGVGSAHVFGMSMGGIIAQVLGLDAPERVRSLILGCTVCGGPGAVLAEPEVYAALAARAEMSLEDGLRATIPYTYDPGTPAERIEEDLEIRRRCYPTSEGYLAQLSAGVGYSTFDRLKDIRVPTLVIHGESDRLVPPGNGRQLASQIAGAQLEILPRASHVFTSDQPEVANETVLRFLRDLETGK